MKPYERLRITSTLSGLLGFAEGQMLAFLLEKDYWEEHAKKTIAEEPYFVRARALLRELEAAWGESGE